MRKMTDRINENSSTERKMEQYQEAVARSERAWEAQKNLRFETPELQSSYEEMMQRLEKERQMICEETEDILRKLDEATAQ